MIPQDGDHYAHPEGDPDLIVNDPFRVMARTVSAQWRAGRAYRAKRRAIDALNARAALDQGAAVFRPTMQGVPARDTFDEDRAQEARAGAATMRRRGWGRLRERAYAARTIERQSIAAIVRTFVPRDGDPFIRPGWDVEDARMGR